MKKILFIVYLLNQIAYGAMFDVITIEPKIGITPYQSYEDRAESESFNDFFDYGLDVYFGIPKVRNLEIGGGAEIRRLHFLLSERKNVGLFFTLFKFPTLLDSMLVSRLGFLQNTHLQKTFYYALGIEKSIKRVVFQVLFDDMRIKDNALDSHYRSVVFKMGIKI